MEKFVKDIVMSFGEEIMEGNTDVTPYQKGDKKACDYCPYQGVCGFDQKIEGYKFRKLHEFSNEDIWNKMSLPEEEGGEE